MKVEEKHGGKNRKAAEVALRCCPACTLPQVLRQLVKKIKDSQNNALTSGTHHANSKLSETLVRGLAATSQNQSVAAGGRSFRFAGEHPQ